MTAPHRGPARTTWRGDVKAAHLEAGLGIMMAWALIPNVGPHPLQFSTCEGHGGQGTEESMLAIMSVRFQLKGISTHGECVWGASMLGPHAPQPTCYCQARAAASTASCCQAKG